jgi:hypothetical protein
MLYTTFQGNLLDFFRWIPVNFLCFPAGTGQKSSEKSEKFPVGILLPLSSDFWCFPAGIGP